MRDMTAQTTGYIVRADCQCNSSCRRDGTRCRGRLWQCQIFDSLDCIQTV